jgi:ABC-type xylose transport system permease subunit
MAEKVKIQEGLGGVRFILVWSSLSPVFLLWAIRGVDKIPDEIWVPICLILFLLPTLLLWGFFELAKRRNNDKTITVQSAKDQREHLLTYLFAMLIPLFDASLGGYRDVIAVFVALLFVLFLFWHMRLHYMNLFFAMGGYRIFTVEAISGTEPERRDSQRLTTYAVLSKRHNLPMGEPLKGWRLGGNVLVDQAEDD